GHVTGVQTCALPISKNASAFVSPRRQRSLEHSAACLDRYAARRANFVLVVTRIAVLGAQSAQKDTGNQSGGSAGISRGRVPWLRSEERRVGKECRAG